MEHTYTKKSKPVSKTTAPCPAPEPPPTVTCCELVCFERPTYFCGHLLTDADLMREQWYFREKNKLYHRTLHGHGIVCGLRLTCDPQCPGGVVVEEGYAIDNCGNDLVVCEPLPFDVVGPLREKGYLVEAAPADPCKPKAKEPECKVRQCFYVTICYQEEPAEFTTPLIAGCRSGPSECEPTRIREGVRFDILAELPDQGNWLDDLKSRVEACFKVFSEGAFAQALKDNSEFLAKVSQGEATQEDYRCCCEIFYHLRGLFLLYLKKHPDKYNCNLEEEILKIHCPQTGEYYDKGWCDCICELLKLIWQYVVSCALGEMIPRCAEPTQASCIVLGTVEVENGHVARVCNCPRSYVWSFAHFFEVLLATLMDDIACEKDNNYEDKDPCSKKDGKKVCCRAFELDCECLLKLLDINPAAPLLAGTEMMRELSSLKRSLVNAFDFTDACKYSPDILRCQDVKKAETMLRRLGIPYRTEVAPLLAKAPQLLEVGQRCGLATFDKPVVLSVSEQQKTVETAYSETYVHAKLAPEEQEKLEKELEEKFAQASTVAALQTQVQYLQEELKKLQYQINKRTKPG